MTAQCVAIGTDATGMQVIVPDDTCAQSLMLIDSATYATLASNPLMIPMDQAPLLVGGALVLVIGAWSVRMAIKVLMS